MSDDPLPPEVISIIGKHNVWTEDGRKIDLIKFAKLMSEINGISEQKSVEDCLDWLGIKYSRKDS